MSVVFQNPRTVCLLTTRFKLTYDANDRLTTDTYDADGNTVASNGNAYAYDFENQLKTFNGGAATFVYDGDGHRVAKTAGGITTKYLVDDRNITGYAQVLEEIVGGAVQRVYTYGPNRISQSQASGTSFYGYDGHGSVRLLTDATAVVTDRYDYDAFGNIISQAGTTSNVYLYSGEQNNPNLGLYYLRARYLSQSSGGFWTMDNVEGDQESPVSLHRYTYAGNEPVLPLDPSGNQDDAGSISADETNALGFSAAGPGMNLQNIFKKIRYNCELKRRDCWVPEGKPVDESVPVNSAYSWRGDPPTWHPWVNFVVPEGTEVYATAAGIVSQVDPTGAYDPTTGKGSRGKFVEIEHKDDRGIVVYRTEYSNNSKTLVSRGEFVGFGSKIAESGHTGYVIPADKGYHVHYEIYKCSGACRIRVDPEDYFEPWITIVGTVNYQQVILDGWPGRQVGDESRVPHT